MQNCYQFEKQTILEHGKSVHNYYLRLLEELNSNTATYLLPNLLYGNQAFIKGQYSLDIMKQYHIMHDCGKPYCLAFDTEGKKHFNNHAEISYQTYIKAITNSGLLKLTGKQQTIANLIKNDMLFHSTSMENIKTFIDNEKDKSFIYSLLLTSFAEIYSNANMFGKEGTNSTSFKIKYKKLCRITNYIFK